MSNSEDFRDPIIISAVSVVIISNMDHIKAVGIKILTEFIFPAIAIFFIAIFAIAALFAGGMFMWELLNAYLESKKEEHEQKAKLLEKALTDFEVALIETRHISNRVYNLQEQLKKISEQITLPKNLTEQKEAAAVNTIIEGS